MRTQESHDELGGNFFDYNDDEEALVHECEVAQTLTKLGCPFSDPAFPASPKSLYRTPQQPPAGAMPPNLAVWARISHQEIRRCHSPVTFFDENGIMSAVRQGALGDSWLLSALNILLPSEVLLRKVIVSDRHRDKGLYTLKLFKEGSWRYLHVDDRLPCWPLGNPYYCSCKDPDQVWAPLIEKAFAKLYGCYENLGRGSIEQGLRCLSGTPLLRTSLRTLLRSESSPRSTGSEAVADGIQRRRDELWVRLKSWQDRGCAMGCCRSLEHDRDRTKSRAAASQGFPRTPKRFLAGLMAGRGYGIRRVCQVSAAATATRDAVTFKLVELSCPWGMGYWRGPWSAESTLWSRYPSIDAELRPKPEELGSLAAESSNAAMSSQEELVNGGWTGTFWMSIEDFSTEFSQIFTCVSYSSPQESSGGIPRKKCYKGRWIPGDPFTGSGGGCTSPTFLKNPSYPLTIQRSSTTLMVALSVADRRWKVDPCRSCPAIGYYILRLTGSKPRLTKLHPKEIAARSEVFVAGCQVAGEHTLEPGRYAVVPATVDPLQVAEVFLLDLATDKEVEWEQEEDFIPGVDHELRPSGDEENGSISTEPERDAAVDALNSVTFPEESVEFEDLDGPPGDKMADAMHEQIAELSALVAELTSGGGGSFLHGKSAR